MTKRIERQVMVYEKGKAIGKYRGAKPSDLYAEANHLQQGIQPDLSHQDL
jgi:hypothetical protein